jgi:competence protein ComEC
MKRPLVILTVIFCLGIILADWIKLPLALIYGLAIISLVFSLLSFKQRLIFYLLLFSSVFLLGVFCLKNYQFLAPCHISKFIKYSYYGDNKSYTVKGVIVNTPELRQNKTILILKTQEIVFRNLKHNCCGNILVYLKGHRDLYYAEELILTGNLYHSFNNRAYKRKSYGNYLYNQGIRAIMNVRSPAGVIKLNKGKTRSFKGLAFWLKAKMEEIIFKHVSPIAASILDAMILGERKNIPAWVNNSMIKSGTVHILVVSGFNVGIVAFMVILFLKLIRIPRRIRFYIATPLLIIYCLATGASTPVVRATVMAIVFMFSYWVKREPDIYNSLSLACLFILAVNPRQLFDVGFQLSFASVISIVCLYPKLKSLLRVGSLKIRFIRFTLEGCLVSLSAWLGTMGLVAYYFKIFSPVTVLANMFIVPLATLITLCGFSLVIIGLIFPPFAPLFSSSSELVVTLLLAINTLLIKLPAAYFSWT